MGLIKAGIGAVSGVLADQWKEFFYCESLTNDVLMVKGQKRISKRSSNKKASDNIISNGSGIAVADGQCMIIVEQGKVVEFCAEPGEFTYDSSTEPSIFTGKLGTSIKETFKQIGKRFTYGGDTGKDQRVYYFNTKDILDNKFGTPAPIIFEVVNKRLGMSKTVNVRCNGTYTYSITDPILFYTKLAGNVTTEYRREQIDAQLKADFIDALQPAFAELTELELRPAQIPAHTKELKEAINHAMQTEWTERRGITVQSIAIGPISLTPEDMKKISEMEDAATMGSNPFMMAGRMTNATADAMNAAAANAGGAMNGFIGMNMAGGAMGGGFGAAQNFYNMGMQQMQQTQQMQTPAQPSADAWRCSCGETVSGKFCPNCGAKKPEQVNKDAWKCACGATATGKFCPECGAKKPADEGWTCTCGAVNKGKFCPECGARKPMRFRCDKCGWVPADPSKPPKFCPECGDRFDDNDV